MVQITDKGNGFYVAKIALEEVQTLDIPALKDKFNDEMAKKNIRSLVIDLSNVKMITSSGIGIFLTFNQTLKSQLRLATANEEVKKVLELTKVTSVIPLFNTVDDAIASF